MLGFCPQLKLYFDAEDLQFVLCVLAGFGGDDADDEIQGYAELFVGGSVKGLD